MAFTDHCDIFGAVHEHGINTVVNHIMRQRPSLFNYATPVFHQRPELFCVQINPAQKVLEAGNPHFTEVQPLPILGAPLPLGVNFCLQLTDAQIDFHPNNAFDLPPELKPMATQRFALHLKACAGIDCPPKEVIDQLLPFIESFLVAQRKKDEASKSLQTGRASMTHVQPTDFGMIVANPERGDPFTLPTRELICFCLELFAVGHFEWGAVAGSDQQWLKPRLDGIEIVDLQPTPMENAIECYLSTILRLGILPKLMMPMEKMVLDITAMLEEQGLKVGQQIDLGPSVVPTDVPNNPAVEEDQLKVFIKLTITQGA